RSALRCSQCRADRGQRARPRPNRRERPFRTTPLIQQVAAASSLPRPPQVSPRSNGGFQSSVDDDCKPHRAATSCAARIIPGNSALTTATTAGAITITILSPSSCPRRAIPTCNKQLSQPKARNDGWVQDWKELIRG